MVTQAFFDPSTGGEQNQNELPPNIGRPDTMTNNPLQPIAPQPIMQDQQAPYYNYANRSSPQRQDPAYYDSYQNYPPPAPTTYPRNPPAPVYNNIPPQSNQYEYSTPQSNGSRQALEMITKIGENDVTHGKGPSSGSHKGNEFYRTCLKKYYKRYVQSDDTGREKIASKIYNEVISQNPKGRFLLYVTDQNAYTEMNSKQAKDYVRCVLTDCVNRERKKLVEKQQQDRQQRKRQRLEDNSKVEDVKRSISDATVEPSGESDKKSPSNIQSKTTTTTIDLSKDENVPDEAKSSFESKYCHKCLGTGLLPVPEALKRFSTEESTEELQTPKSGGEEISLSQANGSQVHGDLGSQLQALEQKLGITVPPNITYPDRIKQIEAVLQQQKKTTDIETAFLINDDIIKMLERAEEKWGIKPPEGYTVSERVELVEQTAFTFMSRLKVWL